MTWISQAKNTFTIQIMSFFSYVFSFFLSFFFFFSPSALATDDDLLPEKTVKLAKTAKPIKEKSNKILIKKLSGYSAIPAGMVYIPAGTFLRGSEGKQDNGRVYKEESPVHSVTVNAFFMDKTEVTNAQFKAFVDATAYVTFAEKGLSKKEFPHAPASMLQPGAAVFASPKTAKGQKLKQMQWWSFRAGASWRHPTGKGSSIVDKMHHPVVCVNIEDARAYAKWAGKRLPTEAEWERAARGGLKQKKYVWGDERKPKNQWLANCFQGVFPDKNSKEDGFLATAPVGSYPANAYGLFDMAGNVWELCDDYFHPQFYQDRKNHGLKNPTGPALGITDYEVALWRQTGNTPVLQKQKKAHPLSLLHVIKGGSFLCHIDYCLRYRPAARHHAEGLTPTNHIGFRCVKEVHPLPLKKLN